MVSPTERDSQADSGDTESDEALMQRLFAIGGARQTADQASLRRAEEAFRSALAPVVQRRKRKRTVITISIAASLVAAVGLGFVYTQQQSWVATDVPVASFVRSDGPVEVIGGNRAKSKSVYIGESVMTGDSGRASLRYHGSDVRLDVATTVRFDPARLVLERGALYVDTDAREASEPPVVIETRFGMVGHTGTQFIARLDTNLLTVGVREGTVFVKSGSGRRDMTAQPHEAYVAQVDPFGEIQIHPAAPFGGLWAWVPETSPEFTSDGKSVDAYLDWLGREYGYSIEYGDAATESRAKATLLHGDLNGMTVADAFATVGATTRLAVDLDTSGVVRVSSEGNHDAHPRNDGQQ
jgi:ferric-dicitrate binding protein FerR (iron transport regulator)